MSNEDDFERWNTHFSTIVEQRVFELDFKLAQDPSSYNLGTTVWDASIVLAKFFEKNAKKGELSRTKVKGRSAIELGAGMGLAGMAFALLGANVVLTDTTEAVLSLLKRNLESNLSPSTLKLNSDTSWVLDVLGKTSVAELDWKLPQQYRLDHFMAEHSAALPPFDYVLAADCVYNENAVPHFLRAIEGVTGPKSLVIVCNEFRSESVHSVFLSEFSKRFTMKKVGMNKMDAKYQHSMIHIFLMKKRKDIGGDGLDDGDDRCEVGDKGGELDGNDGGGGGCEEIDAREESKEEIKKSSDQFRVRRQGSQLGKILAKSMDLEDDQSIVHDSVTF